MPGETNLRSIAALINKEEPAWPMIQEWIDAAKNHVEVLACTPEKGNEELYKVQVTTRSPMGAIVHGTGGILIDHGWIRILGAGAPRLNRSLHEWNTHMGVITDAPTPPYLIVADDVVGGYFAVNGGGLGTAPGKVFYFAPDTKEFESLDISYSEFLGFCFDGNLDKFYSGLRWDNWEEEVSKLDGNLVYSFYPFLGTAEAQDINSVSRKAVSIHELIK
jgi:hypothetical protein